MCCSGNLAHIYIRGAPEPVFFEQIDEMHPELIAGLLMHPGIGFLMVRSLNRGLLLLGPQGLRAIEDNAVEGKDPLLPLRRPEVAVQQLKRLGRFPHMGDIVANSIIEGDHVVSFENQTGSHGGIGGPQNYPFIIVPGSKAAQFRNITSPEQLYPLLSMFRNEDRSSERAG